jgi:hypothetical protein
MRDPVGRLNREALNHWEELGSFNTKRWIYMPWKGDLRGPSMGIFNEA